MVDYAWQLIRKYYLNNGSNKVYVDASQPGFIRSLKSAVGEFTQYEYFVEKATELRIAILPTFCLFWKCFLLFAYLFL
jgi:hypothetical protein